VCRHAVRRAITAAIAAYAVMILAACSNVSFIERISIVNGTDYSADVDVSDGRGNGWLGLAVAEPHSTTRIGEVIDQGPIWVFRFDYVGKYHQELKISRKQLRMQHWSVRIPITYGRHLNDLGFAPTP
jgi:hypothetical protein